jgi:hypothetical protein
LKPKAVFEKDNTNISKDREGEGTRQPDRERMNVVVVHTQCQAEDEVVDDREDEAGGDTIVGEYV